MELVPLAADHVETIVALEAEIFAGHDPWTRLAFDTELVGPRSLWRVALEGGAIAGYGGGWIVTDEFHLLNLATAPAYRRRGIAGSLLTALLRAAAERKCRRATLEVRRGNEAARALYERFGFRAEGMRRKYYTDGEDAMIYWLEDLTRTPAT